ncbi:MAG: cysteine--tRNA ligase, partial [Chloroflexi bacterium]|nr:cysteine--tRNA ligase [Chloroflexota bacterium]
FARHWMHNGWVVVSDEKMSKSLGNFTNLRELVAWADPRAYRLLVLQSHYRAPIEVTEDTVKRAARTLDGLDAFARRFGAAPFAADPDPAVVDAFRERMDDDLDTPGAMALLFETVRRANRDGDEGAAAAVFEMAAAVGLGLRTDTGDVTPEAAELARRRDEARAAKDWATSDALRAELQAMGYEVEDAPTGTVVRRR